MAILKGANLLLAFLLELAMLAAFGYWAHGVADAAWLRWPLVVLMVGMLTALWAVVAAPKSPRRLGLPGLTLFKIGIFGLAALALAGAGQSAWGIALAAAAAVNIALARLWGQERPA